MKLPRFTLRELFLLVVIAAMGCGTSGQDKLYGTWNGYSGTIQPATLTFGPRQAVRIEVAGEVNEGSYRVDWNKSPPHLDLNYRSGKSIKTLVDVSGETLTLQNNDPGKPRPQQFDDNAVTFTRE